MPDTLHVMTHEDAEETLPGTVVVERVPFRADFYQGYLHELRERSAMRIRLMCLLVAWFAPIILYALGVSHSFLLWASQSALFGMGALFVLAKRKNSPSQLSI